MINEPQRHRGQRDNFIRGEIFLISSFYLLTFVPLCEIFILLLLKLVDGRNVECRYKTLHI